MKQNKETVIREICLVAGFFSFASGLWMIYPPATFVICGSIIMWLGLPPKGGGNV